MAQAVLVEALRDGRAEVISLESGYGTSATVMPEEQVDAYAMATRAAIEDGFAGLRVVADATALVRTPDSLDSFRRYEHLIDRYLTAEPFSAVCAYDRSELPEPAVTRLSTPHPVNNTTSAPFRLHAGLRFLDHHGLLALHGYACANEATLVLRSEKSALPRLIAIFGLDDVDCVR